MSCPRTRRIDQLLPDYDFTERHHRDIEARAAPTYEAARHLDFSRSKITRVLFKMRRLNPQGLTIDAMTHGGSFAVIDEDAPHEFVIGHVSTGRTSVSIRDSDHFASLTPTSGIKIAWNFHTEPLSENLTRLHTETRIACYGRITKAVFTAYWIVIRPFSGLIRKEMLKAVRP